MVEGDPGVGKGHLCDQLALELTGSRYAIEQINGQSLSIDVVRHWKQNAVYGNLFSDWTVKRVDEIDQASSSAMSELLSFLDYLPRGFAIIATTNEFAKLHAACKGRLESRFIRYNTPAPSVAQTAAFLMRRYKLPKAHAKAIALGAVPQGCLPSVGCNVRTAINDAKGLKAAQANGGRKATV